jgi:competence protein ComEC
MPATATYLPTMARLIFPALPGFLAGSALQLQQTVLYAWQVYAGLMLLACLLLFFLAIRSDANHWRKVVTALAFGLLGFALTGLRAGVFLGTALNPALEGRDLLVTGVVVNMPQRNETGLRFRLDIESAQMQGKTVVLPHSVYLGWYSGFLAVDSSAGLIGELQRQPAPLVAGERWQLTVRLKAPHGASNPFGFDYELWLWEQDLQATGYVRVGPRDPLPQRLAQTFLHPVERARQQVRDQIFERVAERQYAGLIAALVVGDQNAIDRADWDIFRATGVAHLMSISGLHITMFAWAAALLVGGLWRRSASLCLWLAAPSAALVGGVALASAYAFFSGWGVPSQRTMLMLACVGLLRLSGKRWPWPQVWLVACTAVVLTDPWALLQAGFWLSFVAVGVLFATDSGAAHAELSAIQPNGAVIPTKHHIAHAVSSVAAMLREQWVITLALTPLTLLLFGQVSMVGLIANALAIPWITLLVTPLAMFGVLVPALWELDAAAIAALSWYLQTLAGLPFATVSVAQAPIWAGAAGVVGGVLLAMQLPWSLRLCGLPLLLPVLLWQSPRPLTGQFELLAADIGQGNAVFVRTASHALLYDAGPRFSRESDAGHRVLVPLLRALDTPLDLLVLSHRDSDHTGGALAVLKMQASAGLLSSIEDDHELQAVRQARRCVAGQRWRWDGVDFEVLHPAARDYEVAAKGNAMSCTLRISNGSASALLVGDIEQAQEARLVLEQANGPVNGLKSDLLLVPHHGSKSSSSAAFLDAVQPRFALVQTGYRNRFGHPAEPVLVRYRERNIQLIDSPHCGAFTWESAQPQNHKCQRAEGLRYWHHALP